MLKKLASFIALFTVMFASTSMAQVNSDSLQFRQTLKKGDVFFTRKSYDSAFTIYNKAYTLAKEKKLLDYYSVSVCLLYMGHCYFNRSQYTEAHQWYYTCLQNSRKYDHYEMEVSAFRQLNDLHRYVSEENVTFPYPVIKDYSEQPVLFSISKILFQKDDSAVVVINGGSYDGVIKEKNEDAELFSIVDGATKEDGTYKGVVKIIRVFENRTTASISLKELSTVIKPGWQVKLLVNTPATVTESPMNDAYRLNFQWQDTAGTENIFNRRFLYYFSDKEMNTEIMDLFREELRALVKKWAPDTLNVSSRFRQPISEGIFIGKNLIAAIAKSNVASINYFYHFMEKYSANYSGRPFKFGEVYASWAFNNSELTQADLKKYILGDEKKSADIVQRASLVIKQVEKNNTPSVWVDAGLKMIDKSYWGDLWSQSKLLYNYGIASNRKDYIGWSNFFRAVDLKDYGSSIRSDSFMTAAYDNFQTAGSVEGMQWLQSVKPVLADSSGIQLSVQRSHASDYDVYPSPNDRYFATASKDFAIKIWDINLGKQIHTINGHTDEVYSLAYNPGGRYLASLSYDSTIKIWNTFSYGLMNSFKPPTLQATIKFSPDGKYLISSGFDSTVNFWEPFTGKLVRTFRSPGGYVRDFCFRSQYPDMINLLCTDSAVYEYRLDTLLVKRVLKSEKAAIISYFFSNDGKHVCYTKTDSTFTIWNLENGKFEYSSKIYAWKYRNSRHYSDGAFSPDSKYFLFCTSDSTRGYTNILNLQQRRVVKLWHTRVNQYVFNSNGNYFIVHDLLDPVIVDFSDFDWQKVYNILYKGADDAKWNETYYYSLKGKEFGIKSQQLLETRFAADDKSLSYLSWGYNKLNLSNGKSELLYSSTHMLWGNHDYPKNEDILVYRKLGVDDTLYLHSKKDKIILAALSIPGNEDVSSFSFFDDDKFCFLGGTKGSIACWNIQEKKLLYYKRNISGGGQPFNSTIMQPGTKRMIAFGSKTKPWVIDSENGNLLDSINIPKVDRATFTKNKLFFTSDSGRLFYAGADHYEVTLFPAIKSDKNFLTEIAVSSNEKYLYVLDDPFCYVFETGNLQLVNRFVANGKNFLNFSVSHNDSMVAIGSANGEFSLYKPFSGKLISTIYLTGPNDVIITDSSGYYLASKNALKTVIFNRGYRSFNYDQFDLQLNQPHKVLSAIGVADNATVLAFEKAYEKRLQRNGVVAGAVTQGQSPSITVLNRGSIRPTTSQEFLTVRVSCYDDKNKLSALKIFVNDVPLNDVASHWSALDTTDQIFTIKIPLTTGKNKVKIYCVNKLGLSSYKEMFDIFCIAKEQKQDTYFIGLGVNIYADKAKNLTYSVKDIRDMARSFKKLYPGIIIDTLMNSKVTLKNIELLKQRLKKIKVTDRVIMAVTGHGLLSDSLDFYYATYDVDFKKPAAKGLKYEDLENMLSNTAARQRLLLIDACHSGMLDKETVVKTNTDTISATVKIKNARGIEVVTTQKPGDANSFNLMQNQFADFSNDNGIVVISAAGGLEFAFESAKWHNGVFTYCVLKGLEEKEADKETEGGNEDSKVSVQELMRYVSDKVPKLTKGMQQPTSRRENLDFDWIIK